MSYLETLMLDMAHAAIRKMKETGINVFLFNDGLPMAFLRFNIFVDTIKTANGR